MNTQNFEIFLFKISSLPLSVFDASVENTKYVPLNLSESNIELQTIDVSSSLKLGSYISSVIKKQHAVFAFGGYNETRTIYKRSNHFNSQSKNERNIHIGMDLWCDANSPVFVPLDATVHSFKNNANFGDYGPTIILKHCIEDVEFYTLYGHLSLKSIQHLKIGQVFKKGEQLATLGDASINGDYPPHLHFQIIRAIEDYKGDYPGVCSKSDLEFYLNNCPDPNLLLKLEF